MCLGLPGRDIIVGNTQGEPGAQECMWKVWIGNVTSEVNRRYGGGGGGSCRVLERMRVTSDWGEEPRGTPVTI